MSGFGAEPKLRYWPDADTAPTASEPVLPRSATAPPPHPYAASTTTFVLTGVRA